MNKRVDFAILVFTVAHDISKSDTLYQRTKFVYLFSFSLNVRYYYLKLLLSLNKFSDGKKFT